MKNQSTLIYVMGMLTGAGLAAVGEFISLTKDKTSNYKYVTFNCREYVVDERIGITYLKNKNELGIERIIIDDRKDGKVDGYIEENIDKSVNLRNTIPGEIQEEYSNVMKVYALKYK